MFNIDTNRRSLSNLPLIVDNYEVIHFDDIPYLYYGTNKYGTKIIGSLLIEDEKTDNLRYVHSLVDNTTFHRFICQEIPYRELIEKCSDVFIVDKNINEKPIAIYSVTPDLIPKEYLPVPDYLCPRFNFSIGNDFVLSLHGSIADAHLAFPFELSKIQEKFEKVLNKTLQIFERLNISPVVKQRAYAEGSFQLRFNVAFDEYKEMFILQENLYHTVAIILKELIPSEKLNTDANKKIEAFLNNKDILKKLKTLLEPSAVTIDEEFITNAREKFEQIVEHYSELSENLGNGYNEIELLVERNNSKDLVPINIINRNTRIKLSEIVDKIELDKHDIETDDDYKEYKISIYSLNTESRSGKAQIYSKIDDDIMDKPSIKIQGKDSLEKSMFTESLHLNKWITVHAKATTKDDVFKKLVIENE